jgi:aminoglycoside 2'-N-acetyltransferase I
MNTDTLVASDTLVELIHSDRLVDGSAVDPAETSSAPQTNTPESADWLPGVPTDSAMKGDPQGWFQRALMVDTAAARVNVLQLAVENLSPDERRQTLAFTRHTLDHTLGAVRPFALPADTYSWNPPSWSALIKSGQRVVAHAGIIYRVLQVGQLRVPVAGIGGVMTLPDWRRRGYARALLANATAFAALQLWAPFAMVICPKEDSSFYQHLGWQVAEAPIWCEQPGGRIRLQNELALYLACQGDAEWPSGSIDLGGTPW